MNLSVIAAYPRISFYGSEDINALLGPALNEEDCYIHAIKQHQGDMSYGDSYLYCMTLEELNKLTKEFGIEVERLYECK